MVLVLTSLPNTYKTQYVNIINLNLETNLIRWQGGTKHTMVGIPNYRVGKGWKRGINVMGSY